MLFCTKRWGQCFPTAIIKERRKNVFGIIFVGLNSEAEFQHISHITLDNQGFCTF